MNNYRSSTESPTGYLPRFVEIAGGSRRCHSAFVSNRPAFLACLPPCAFSEAYTSYHAHAIAIHYMHYNFCRIHQTLRVTPAVQAGLSDHVWEIEELVGLLEADEAKMIVQR